jgi:hypothetical protein
MPCTIELATLLNGGVPAGETVRRESRQQRFYAPLTPSETRRITL